MGGSSCTRFHHSRWSLKSCRKSLSLQVFRWFWSLLCRKQLPVPRRSHPTARRRSATADSGRHSVWQGDRDSSLPAVKSSRVETLRAILVAKGHSWEAAEMISRSHRESSLHVYESHWGRFVHFCRSKRWHVFRVRSHNFRWIASIDYHFTSHVCGFCVTSLGLWSGSRSAHQATHQSFSAGMSGAMKNHAQVWPSSRTFGIDESAVHLGDRCHSTKWRTMKTVFLLALTSARWRSYLHALSVAPGRCVFSRGNTQRQLMVSLLLEAGFLAKNQLPSQAPQWISMPGLNRNGCFALSGNWSCIYGIRSESSGGGDSGCSFIGTAPSETSWEVI